MQLQNLKKLLPALRRTPAPNKTYIPKVEKSEPKPKKSILKTMADIQKDIRESSSLTKFEPSTLNVASNKAKAENIKPIKKLHTEARIEHYRSIRDKGYLTSGLMGNQAEIISSNLVSVPEIKPKLEPTTQKKVEFKSTTYGDNITNDPTQTSFVQKETVYIDTKNAKHSRQLGTTSKISIKFLNL